MSDDGSDEPKPSQHRVLAIVLAAVAIVTLGFALLSQTWLYGPRTRLELREGDSITALTPYHEVGFGLRGMFECKEAEAGEDRECRSMSNAAFVESWRREVLVLRYMTDEPIEDELRAFGGDELVDQAKAERISMLRGISDPTARLAVLQQELAVTKRAYKTSGIWAPLGWIVSGLLVLGVLGLAVTGALVLASKRGVWPIMPTTVAFVCLGLNLIAGCMFVALKPGPPGYIGVWLGFFTFGVGTVLGLTSTVLLNKLLRPADPDLLEDAMNPEQF